MKFDLSIVIVNYNVCYFLEQTLLSVEKAIKPLNVEVFVVDNCSKDGSVQMVRDTFPWVKLIANEDNKGFSTANNQAIKLSDSDFVLLLNPDTILQEDTLEKCLFYILSNPLIGGLGVKMIDGAGHFLPESKRGLPTPWVSFCKISGLSKVFKQSSYFNCYHLGFLDKNQNHEVEVLSGAFMWLRKSVLDQVGLLDEDYFMYGEDIDLSYRICKGGYKNFYFAETEIIHYKGESTKKSSTNYVKVFYGAMSIFASKHFNSGYAKLFSFLLSASIQLRAFVALIARYVFRYGFVAFSSALIFLLIVVLKQFWEQTYKPIPGQYPTLYLTVIIPSYLIIWVLSVYYSGGFDKPYKNYRVVRGVLVGTILISSLSNFLDTFRYSKTLIVLGAFSATSIWIVVRYISNYLNYRQFSISDSPIKKAVVIGDGKEAERVVSLLSKIYRNADVLGIISSQSSASKNLGQVHDLTKLVAIYQPDALIFCSESMSYAQIVSWMNEFSHLHIEYNIVPKGRDYVIGSQSKNTQGQLHTFEPYLALFENQNKRKKRIIELAFSLAMIVFAPLLLLGVKNKWLFIQNSWYVLLGIKAFVGVDYLGSKEFKKSVINPWTEANRRYVLDQDTRMRLEMIYAKDYNPIKDVRLIYDYLRGC